MLKIGERLKQLNDSDLAATYVAKFCLGLGIGLLWAAQQKGWVFIFLALIVGVRAEIKFWRKG